MMMPLSREGRDTGPVKSCAGEADASPCNSLISLASGDEGLDHPKGQGEGHGDQVLPLDLLDGPRPALPLTPLASEIRELQGGASAAPAQFFMAPVCPCPS